jgi:transglutaminase-like putative cysteine protease
VKRLMLLALLVSRLAGADDLSKRYISAIEVVAQKSASLASPLSLRLDYDGQLKPLTVSRYQPDPAAATDAQKKPSFLLDYDDPVFAPVHKAALDKLGEHPTPEQLTVFADGWISTKNNIHGWDTASMVAKSRAGDCTEHAVLLAALLRSFGYAARVVAGLVLVNAQTRTMAFGHAWAEVVSDGGWRPLDATRSKEKPDHTWLPIFVVTNEGMSFERDLVRGLAKMPQRVLLP